MARYESLTSARGNVEGARRSDDKVREARALLELGKGYAAVGLSVEATTAFEEAAVAARQAGDRALVARSLANAGSQLHRSGQGEEASALCREAVAEFRAQGDGVGELRALANCAVIEGALGRSEQAVDSTEGALRLAARLDDRGLLVGLHSLHADLLTSLRRPAEARAARGAAVAAARRLTDPAALSAQLEGLGEQYLLEGRHDEALGAYHEAADLHGQRGDVAGRYRTILQLGLLYRHASRWSEAHAALAEALDLCRRTGDVLREPYVQANLASTQLELGRCADAARHACEAAAGYRRHHDPVGTGRALATLGRAQAELGCAGAAADSFGQALGQLSGVDEVGAAAVRRFLSAA